MNVVVCKKKSFFTLFRVTSQHSRNPSFFKNHAFLKTAEVSKTSFSYSQIDR